MGLMDSVSKMQIYDLCYTSRIIYRDLIRDIMKFDVKRKYIFDNFMRKNLE